MKWAPHKWVPNYVQQYLTMCFNPRFRKSEFASYNNIVLYRNHCIKLSTMIFYKLHIIKYYIIMTWLPEFIKELRLLQTHKFYSLVVLLMIIGALVGLILLWKIASALN